tara:strand:- start:2194 stop:2874 length:681 start_codon:yes stop_codon:yes gene_type:complete
MALTGKSNTTTRATSKKKLNSSQALPRRTTTTTMTQANAFTHLMRDCPLWARLDAAVGHNHRVAQETYDTAYDYLLLIDNLPDSPEKELLIKSEVTQKHIYHTECPIKKYSWHPTNAEKLNGITYHPKDKVAKENPIKLKLKAKCCVCCFSIVQDMKRHLNSDKCVKVTNEINVAKGVIKTKYKTEVMTELINKFNPKKKRKTRKIRVVPPPPPTSPTRMEDIDRL